MQAVESSYSSFCVVVQACKVSGVEQPFDGGVVGQHCYMPCAYIIVFCAVLSFLALGLGVQPLMHNFIHSLQKF
jgi:hypothetical protein